MFQSAIVSVGNEADALRVELARKVNGTDASSSVTHRPHGAGRDRVARSRRSVARGIRIPPASLERQSGLQRFGVDPALGRDALELSVE